MGGNGPATMRVMSDLLRTVHEIAKHAGQAIMEIYGSDDFNITHKEDDSPLTRADLAAHDTICQELAQLDEAYPVISEEDQQPPADIGARYWLVDPLDGTKEFIKRNGEFTVNIGLINDGYPVLGVVYAPDLDITYLGQHGQGAQKITGGRRQDIKSEFHGSVPKVVASRSHRDAHIEQFLTAIGEHEETSMGSSLKLCLIAEGAAMLYPRLAPTHAWDTAAADAVVRAAGGTVQDIHGADLIYRPADTKNPFFVAATANAQPWQAALSHLT